METQLDKATSHSNKDLVRRLLKEISSEFIGRDEETRVAILALITKSHAVFIGDPGTAKSALLRSLTERIGGDFYYYLLSKYTIPDELIGPVDPLEYKKGNFKRMTAKRLPECNIAFIDEIFKGSSETLNTLLNIMNERLFVDIDGTVHHVPLISMFAASNELPQGSDLQAFYDRILLKHFVSGVSADKIKDGIILNVTGSNAVKSTISLAQVESIYKEISEYRNAHIMEIANIVSTLVSSMRINGIFVSDRTAMGPQYLPLLVAAYSWLMDEPIKKSAMEVTKYILQDNDEQLNAFTKALESVYPKELRESLNKLSEAEQFIKEGNLGEAEKRAIEAINMANVLVKKDNMFDLYKTEIKEFIDNADNEIKKIREIRARISGV